LNKLGMGNFLRRLFSTFASGMPGAGLLLMRLVTGGALLALGIGEWRPGASAEGAILGLPAIGVGALLVAGLWTPVAGSLVILVEVLSSVARHEISWSCILLATDGAALALLGPGAWSLDAWLFGWKRIDFER
jgi:putative oxidoreductase